MARRKPEHEDENQAAFRVLATATGKAAPKKPRKKRKNPHAVAMGRKGGLAAGKTRMEKIPEKRRKEIARQAAKARWAQKRTLE